MTPAAVPVGSTLVTVRDGSTLVGERDPRVGELEGRRVLVTGGSGFIGSHLTAALIDLGADVHVLTSTVSSVYPHRLRPLRDRVTTHEGNFIDATAMKALVRDARPEIVFHLGAYTHVGKSWNRIDECIQANIQGTVNLLQALDGTGYTRFLNTGTSEIYGDIDVPFEESKQPNPVSPYAVSKFAAEMYCRLGIDAKGWPIVRIRPFNAYGPGQTPDRVIPEIIVRALRGQTLKMTAGKQTREFNYVTDLVDGFLLAAVVPDLEGELLNLGCGEEVSMADLATTILELMGDPIEAQLGALPDRPIEIWRMYCDSTKARELLGWAPRHSLRDGLEATIAWYRQELEAHPDSPFIPGFDEGV
ncbi:NAD-dependent epimerase/dehydratase family protein [Nitriliruptoraceae bacterium ZYF776]|nr:NAD-dependent epimerase/dehydratase family protein [Profundirhabdus halotolerans]